MQNISNLKTDGLQQFAPTYESWKIEDWKYIVCSDESQFLVWDTNDRVRILLAHFDPDSAHWI